MLLWQTKSGLRAAGGGGSIVASAFTSAFGGSGEAFVSSCIMAYWPELMCVHFSLRYVLGRGRTIGDIRLLFWLRVQSVQQ